ncbi:hypothetical protein EUTSA_v10003076mg [Eutrema salsugineum]|uniref:Knottin scorpion toxin-like domain-containing protein n=1 Tax=Eutrema salsugineum TaxID=72664 RepID=V4MX18_EUTSA|nr:putative defensin-like protein 270 [Eutrema salsugineum]ESQ36956.1 hypothetical protein EUTSA_v10003076mg [Eutrema salsugineum]
MTSSKFHFVVLLLIITLIVNVQSTQILDNLSDCEFKGPCQKKQDCYDRCAVNKPPFKTVLCEPYGSARVCCCI